MDAPTITVDFQASTIQPQVTTDAYKAYMGIEEPKTDVLLFGKWKLDFECKELSLKDHICIKDVKVFLPHSARKYNSTRFGKSKCPIVERLVNSMMMHGRNNGKKMMALRHVRDAFEIVHLLTNENPVQVLVNAVVNSGPREDSTRIGKGGAVRRQAVDVSPLRRVNVAVYNLAVGAREASFRNIKTLAECLADELIHASRNSSNSYSVKKKDETERVAKSNR